ncbi:MAG: DUF3006 domain-containing protein [Selenomonadaceae bacterium]|nr:DUF3006 domain-containing protein [Selenomonadaceae bacterium]MEE1363169.1 DUF3006 domain-containing protein [Selenomonadaceae bacterium]
MTVTAYIDRFEGDKAVLYIGDEMVKVDYPKAFLDDELEEGDYIKITIEYDGEATEEALQEAMSLTED